MSANEVPLKRYGSLRYHWNVIEKYAEMGSLTAIRMRSALNYDTIAFNAIEVSDKTNNELFVTNFAHSFRSYSTYPIFCSQLKNKLQVIVKHIIKCEANRESELDINARISYALVNFSSIDKIIDFIEQCIHKYPNEYLFYRFCAQFYCVINEVNKALDQMNKALELQPNDWEVLYERANIMGNGVIVFTLKDVINAYLKFIESVPKDHPKVPESYYAIALLLLRKNQLTNDLIEIKRYYEKGLESEKNQLPFYIPYESTHKESVQMTLIANGIKVEDKSQPKPNPLRRLYVIPNSVPYSAVCTFFEVKIDSKYDLNLIEKYAQMGSLTAIRMKTAFKCYTTAIKALEDDKYERHSDNTFKEIFVNNFAHSFRTYNTIALIPTKFKNKIKAFVKHVIKCETNYKSELDLNARICYALLIGGIVDVSIDFLNECFLKYPNEYLFHQYCGRLYGFRPIERFKKGLEQYNIALQLQPNNCHLLYDKANHLGHDINVFAFKDAINAYFNFIESAPKDHRKLPEAYYAMALLMFTKNVLINDLIEIKSYYEKGLESEKNQLPFLLPYESNRKPGVEFMLNKFGIKVDLKTQSIPSLNKSSEHYLLNDNRIDLIRKHRELVSELKGIHTNCVKLINTMHSSAKPQNDKKSILGLKEIFLKDMNGKRNNVFEGYFMKIKFIEDPFIGLAFIRNVLQDQNEDVIKCFIHNFQPINNESIVGQSFGFGSQMYLINPHLEMAFDGRPVIRIDDTNCLIECTSESRVGNICRYCLKSNAKSCCSRCQRAYYCDQNCLRNDWKQNKHKLICK